MLTIHEALQTAIIHHVDVINLQLILAYILKKNRAYIVTHLEETLTKQQQEQFESMLLRLKEEEPMAYILGEKEFYSLNFKVNNAVLIPRPETEQVIDLIFSCKDKLRISNEHNIRNHVTLLDLGCGSGVIAITVAKHQPSWKIVAVDLSPKAVAVAEENARLHQVTNIAFKISNWFNALPQKREFDIIVSNPPYIAGNSNYLNNKSLSFEPRLALTSGNDGLDALLELIHSAPLYLKNEGYLILEHGFDQQTVLSNVLQDAGYSNIELYQDLAGIPRICLAQWIK